MTFGSGFKVAATSAAAVTVIAADFAPVPFLSPAVGIVVGILQLCDNVRTNRNEIHELGGRCHALLYVLKDNSAQAAPENLQNMVKAAEVLLTDIRDRIMAWIRASLFRQFLQQNDIAEDIKRCHQGIDAFLQSFNIASQMEMHNWMAKFNQQRQEDHNEMITYFSEINNSQQIMQATFISQMNEVKGMMGWMQEQMGSYPVGDYRHTGFQRNLYTIQQSSGQLLPRIELKSGEVRRVSNNPVGGSAAFDIWMGEYLGQEKCAIKVVRGIEVSPKIRDRFLREVTIWRKVWEDDKGEYILPFWGACLNDGPYPYMVSPWMEYGDSLSYVNKYPYVNRKRIIRRIAEGVRLLHSYNPPIAHGDLKAANILINQKGDPLLADFGLSKIMEDLTGMPFTQSRGVSDSYRWFAPELCSAPGVLSTASDVFAYSMTVLELMTGQAPFSHIRRTPEVLIKMQQGERPRRPEGPEIVERGLDDKLWDLLTRCWAADPEQRPSIQEVINELPAE
ncbi:hypothetical protein ACEPAF_7226 [Sanghuangporus sanghuang]